MSQSRCRNITQAHGTHTSYYSVFEKGSIDEIGWESFLSVGRAELELSRHGRNRLEPVK